MDSWHLKGLQPADLVLHLIGSDPVEQSEQAVHRLADRELIGDDDPPVCPASLQPFLVKPQGIRRVEGEDGAPL